MRPSRTPVAPVLMVAAAALLCACVEPAAPDEDACGAAGLQYLVGQDEAALAAITFAAERVRVIRPGQPVTMDYSPERLNIELDAAGRIQRLSCG